MPDTVALLKMGTGEERRRIYHGGHGVTRRRQKDSLTGTRHYFWVKKSAKSDKSVVVSHIKIKYRGTGRRTPKSNEQVAISKLRKLWKFQTFSVN